MTLVSIDEIEKNFLECFHRVRAGETIVITQVDRPIAELKPVETNQSQTRPFGLCSGEFKVSDDFDAPLPQEILHEFDAS